MNQQTIPVYLTLEERDRMIAGTEKPRDRLLLELLFFSGARVSEIVTASVGDLTRHGVRLRCLKRRDKRAVKDVVLPQHFLDQLRASVAGLPLNAPLVSRLDDPLQPITRRQMGRIFHEAGIRAGIYKRRHPDDEFRICWPHVSRHSHAAHLIDAGVPLPVVMAQLGHASLASTQVYAQLNDAARINHVNRALDR